MKKLLLILLVATGLSVWFVANQPNGPSVAEVKRIGIHAFITHAIDKSCTFSVLGDAALSQCTSTGTSTGLGYDKQGRSTEKQYDDTGRLRKVIHRDERRTTSTSSFEYDDTTGNIVVSMITKPFKGSYNTFSITEACQETLATRSALHYRCARTVQSIKQKNSPSHIPSQRMQKQIHTYQYDAQRGALFAQETSKSMICQLVMYLTDRENC